MTDLTFRTAQGVFNYRVAALIIHQGRLLTVRHGQADYYALPGGRVHLHETVEAALVREMQKELQFTPEKLRLLWVNQGFFTAQGARYHELCLYYLAEADGSGLLSRGECFESSDNDLPLQLQWVPLEQIPRINIVPRFLREKINRIPEHPEILTNID